MTSLLQKYITFNPKSKINFESCELTLDAEFLVHPKFDPKIRFPQYL